eukprot:CAMPEP_0179144232 /NCGR_PEP_ID=MMETSP0796-20121207/69465_1 /TAXON_ID=73915 /ORGANISM="Pyrodinium bahamense, Strain pbaha01" /LENGTH=98 /DNA_ID=CAMNT_0020844419 /DNA_START=1 /DNA_END=293 /DNA_ORIENTATION=-
MDWAATSNIQNACNGPLVEQLARTPPERRDYELAASGHAEFVQRMQILEERLAVTGAFLVGDRFTVADVSVGVELSRWSCSLENWAREAARGAAPAPP